MAPTPNSHSGLPIRYSASRHPLSFTGAAVLATCWVTTLTALVKAAAKANRTLTMTADSRDFDLVRFAAFACGLLMPNLTEPHLVMGADAYDSVCSEVFPRARWAQRAVEAVDEQVHGPRRRTRSTRS